MISCVLPNSSKESVMLSNTCSLWSVYGQLHVCIIFADREKLEIDEHLTFLMSWMHEAQHCCAFIYIHLHKMKEFLNLLGCVKHTTYKLKNAYFLLASAEYTDQSLSGRALLAVLLRTCTAVFVHSVSFGTHGTSYRNHWELRKNYLNHSNTTWWWSHF